MTATATGPAQQAPRWGMPDVLVAFLVGQVASVAFLAVFATVRDLPTSSGEDLREALSIGEIALLQIPLWIGLLGVPLVATRLRGNGAVRDLGLWTTWRDAPKGLAIGVLCQFVLVPLVTLPVFWFTDVDRETLEGPARELTDKATGPGVAVLFLVVVVAAPLAEEVFFRGLLQRTLARRLPIWPTMILTAVLFGASHFEAPQFPALAAFGLVLSVLANRTGRLGCSIWAHVGFNATTVVALLVGG